MPDTEREFRIRITGDAAGAVAASQQAAGGLDQVKDKQDQAGEAAAKHSTHIRGLHKLFHSLNEVIPGLGVAMQAAFSPIGATISIAVMALRLFHEKMKEFNEECRKAAEEAAKPLTNRLEQQRETVVRSAEGMERLRERLADAANGEESVRASVERTTAGFKAQQQAAESLADAQKANELAGLEQAHAAGLMSEEQYAAARLEIEQKYQEKKREMAEQEEQLEIQLRERALKDAKDKQAQLAKEAEGAEKNKEKALGDLGSFDKEGIKKRRDDTQKALKDLEDKIGDQRLGDFEQAGGMQATPEAVREQYKRRMGASYRPGTIDEFNEMGDFEKWWRAKQAAGAAEASWKQAPGEEARLRVAAERASHNADRSAQSAEENQRFITEGSRDLDDRRARYDLRHNANQQITSLERDTLRQREATAVMQSPEGKLVAGVAQTEQLRAHGQRVTAGQQAQEKALLDLLKALGMNGPATLGALKDHTVKINDLTKQIQQLRTQHRDTYNQ